MPGTPHELRTPKQIERRPDSFYRKKGEIECLRAQRQLLKKIQGLLRSPSDPEVRRSLEGALRRATILQT